MKRADDIDQTELAKLRDHLLEHPWEDRDTDVEIHKVFYQSPIEFRDSDYYWQSWSFMYVDRDESDHPADAGFVGVKSKEWSKVPRYTSNFSDLEHFVGNAVRRRLSLSETTIHGTDKIDYRDGGWRAELFDSEGRITGSCPVSKTFSAAILLAVFDDVAKNGMWVPDHDYWSQFKDVGEGPLLEDIPTKESKNSARRLARRKELIDSIPASPEAVFIVIQSALIRSDVEDRLLLVWQDQLKSRLAAGWALEWDLERYQRARGFWIRFSGGGRHAFRFQFKFDLTVPEYGITGTKDMLPPELGAASMHQAGHVPGQRRSEDECWLWSRFLAEFGWDWRENEDLWVAMADGRLADWIIKLAGYIHAAIGSGVRFDDLEPPEFVGNPVGAVDLRTANYGEVS